MLLSGNNEYSTVIDQPWTTQHWDRIQQGKLALFKSEMRRTRAEARLSGPVFILQSRCRLLASKNAGHLPILQN